MTHTRDYLASADLGSDRDIRSSVKWLNADGIERDLSRMGERQELYDLIGMRIISPVSADNLEPTDAAFGGTVMAGGGIEIGGVTYSLADILNGVVQVGIIPGGGLYVRGDVVKLIDWWQNIGGVDSSGTMSFNCCVYNPVDNCVYAGGSFSSIAYVADTVNVAKYSLDTNSWSALSTGITGTVYSMAVDSAGNVYIGGTFTNVGDANGDGIVKWNGSAFSSLSTGIGSGTVYSIAVDSADNVYIGGDFTNIGDANGDGIVKWNGSAFSSLSTGVTGTVYSIAVDSADNVYIGGTFTNIGDANGDRIVKWNGSAFSSLSTGISTGSVRAIAVDSADNIYIGGPFTNVGDANGDGIVKWNGSAFSSLSTGRLGGIYAMAVDAVDDVYVGHLTTGIYKWDGSSFVDVGDGLDNAVYGIAYIPDGGIIAGGLFGYSSDGSKLLSRIARYGSSSLKTALDYIFENLPDDFLRLPELPTALTPSFIDGHGVIYQDAQGVPHVLNDSGHDFALHNNYGKRQIAYEFEFGDLGGGNFYSNTAIGAGARAFTPSTANHPGVIRVTQSGANTGYAYVTPDLTWILLAGGEVFECVFQLDWTTNCVNRLGFQDSITTALPVDGAWIHIAGTTVEGKTSNNSVRSTTASSYTLAASTWYRCVVYALTPVGDGITFVLYDAAGTVLWTDALLTDIPTSRTTGVGVTTHKTTAGTENLVDWDWMNYYNTTQLAR